MMHIALFDWTAGGHHPTYVRQVARTLGRAARITIAAPDTVLEAVGDVPATPLSLGAPRPALQPDRSAGAQHADLARQEIGLLADVARRSGADHVIHLYSDPILRWIVGQPRFAVPVSLCLFFVRFHYRAAYGIRLGTVETARAWFQRLSIERWRRRADAGPLLFMDEQVLACLKWPAGWLPEPPIAPLAQPATGEQGGDRTGAVLYGALDFRKGLHLLTAAVAARPGFGRLTLAGPPMPGFEAELARQVDALRRAGADLALHTHHHDTQAGLQRLAAAHCVVLPYPRHYGMSRVLVEASSLGTPAVVHDFGLLGHLVRTYGLGAAVDCCNPAALRGALDRLTGAPPDPALAGRLQRFAERHSEAAFERALTSAFAGRLPPQAGTPQHGGGPGSRALPTMGDKSCVTG